MKQLQTSKRVGTFRRLLGHAALNKKPPNSGLHVDKLIHRHILLAIHRALNKNSANTGHLEISHKHLGLQTLDQDSLTSLGTAMDIGPLESTLSHLMKSFPHGNLISTVGFMCEHFLTASLETLGPGLETQRKHSPVPVSYQE